MTLTFKEKMNLMIDVNGLFEKYGEDNVRDIVCEGMETKIVEKIVEVEKLVYTTDMKQIEELEEMIEKLKEKNKKLEKELEIVKDIDIEDMVRVKNNYKVCKICKENKTLDSFYKEKGNKTDGRRCRCKECEKKLKQEKLSNKVKEVIKEDEKQKLLEMEYIQQVQMEQQQLKEEQEKEMNMKMNWRNKIKVDENIGDKLMKPKRWGVVEVNGKEEFRLTKEEFYEIRSQILDLISERRRICEERTYNFFEKCNSKQDKIDLINKYGVILDEIEIKINHLKRKQNGNYVSLNGESELDKNIRLMGVIMKERDTYLSKEKISWDRERWVNRYDKELGELKDKINRMIGNKNSDWFEMSMKR